MCYIKGEREHFFANGLFGFRPIIFKAICGRGLLNLIKQLYEEGYLYDQISEEEQYTLDNLKNTIKRVHGDYKEELRRQLEIMKQQFHTKINHHIVKEGIDKALINPPKLSTVSYLLNLDKGNIEVDDFIESMFDIFSKYYYGGHEWENLPPITLQKLIKTLTLLLKKGKVKHPLNLLSILSTRNIKFLKIFVARITDNDKYPEKLLVGKVASDSADYDHDERFDDNERIKSIEMTQKEKIIKLVQILRSSYTIDDKTRFLAHWISQNLIHTSITNQDICKELYERDGDELMKSFPKIRNVILANIEAREANKRGKKCKVASEDTTFFEQHLTRIYRLIKMLGCQPPQELEEIIQNYQLQYDKQQSQHK